VLRHSPNSFQPTVQTSTRLLHHSIHQNQQLLYHTLILLTVFFPPSTDTVLSGTSTNLLFICRYRQRPTKLSSIPSLSRTTTSNASRNPRSPSIPCPSSLNTTLSLLLDASSLTPAGLCLSSHTSLANPLVGTKHFPLYLPVILSAIVAMAKKSVSFAPYSVIVSERRERTAPTPERDSAKRLERLRLPAQVSAFLPSQVSLSPSLHQLTNSFLS
jgi:hypothetical protein